MLQHPLIALIARSGHYRLLISGFVLRMTGAYAATLAGVWGAWRYGSPTRAAWFVACLSIASALGALWVGHRHDRGSAGPIVRVAGVLEAAAVTVLALAGTRAVPQVVLLGAGAVAGITRAVWSAAVTPALADAADDDRAVGAFGVGWAFDFGKLAGAGLTALILLAPVTFPLVPATVLLGTVMFTRYGLRPVEVVDVADRPVVAESAVWRSIGMMAVASLCLYQQDLLFRVALDEPAAYALAAAAFAVGAIVATGQLAWNAPRHLPTRTGLIVSLVACAVGTAGLLTGHDVLAAVSAFVTGWGCAFGIQGCRPLFAWAPRPGVASGMSIALMTVATALGAPIVVEILPHAGPAAVLIGATLVGASLLAPDVGRAVAAGVNRRRLDSGTTGTTGTTGTAGTAGTA